MLSAIWGLFAASRGLQIAALVLACWGVWEGNNALQRSMGRTEGRSEVTTIVKEKADANTEVANAAGNDVAAGKPGKPDPNRLRGAGEGRPGK
jgi:hypothetical protein